MGRRKSSLDEQAGRLQCKHLIADAEIRRLQPRNRHERKLEIQGQNNRHKERHHCQAKLGVVSPWLARHPLILRHLNVQVTGTFVFGVHHRTEGTMFMVFAVVTVTLVRAPICVAVSRGLVAPLFVRAAVLKGNTKHLARRNRDQPLHNEQEHADEFDKRWMHGSRAIDSGVYATSAAIPVGVVG